MHMTRAFRPPGAAAESFFVWLVAMAILLMRAIGDDERKQEQAGGDARLSGNRTANPSANLRSRASR
jgi:hypothetical protein